jgi:hypothetical protein
VDSPTTFASFEKLAYYQIILLAGFAEQVVLNKDPTIWRDVARPANTCILPSTPKSML